MMTDRNTFCWLLLMFAGVLQTAAGAVSYTPGDTWKLEGATDWTNNPHFAGLGHIQSTGKPDTNAVWRFMQYDDVSTGPLFNNPTAPTIYCEDANGRYWSTLHSPTYLATVPWISDTWMSIHFKTYGPKWAGAVVWESPVPGTYRLDADLVYTGGVGTVSFGVFYHDADTDSYFQVQKGFLFKSDSYGWTPVTSAVAQASVSLDAGDRLVFLQRTHACHPNNGYDWVYTSGPTLYAIRRCEQRNLTVTLLTTDLTNSVPRAVRSWRRKDLHWRADVEDSLKPANGGTAVVRDRRLPATRPAMFNYYVSTNRIFGHAAVNATGLSEGETLEVALNNDNKTDFFGHYECGCREHLLYYRHNYTGGVQAKPPVWFFRPPKPGLYSITGVLDEQSTLVNNLGKTSFWIGTATLDNFGTNPVVSRIAMLEKGTMDFNGPSVTLDLRCTLESTNHCLYMTVWGQTTSGDRRSSIVDDLLITRERTGSLMILR